MSLPPDHAALLRQQDFAIPAGVALDERQRQLLHRYGHWLEALAAGRIQPLTDDQRHFLAVSRGETPPVTEYEQAWVRLHQARPRATGPMEVSAVLERLRQARQFSAAVRAEREQQREALLAPIRAQLEQIDTAFADEQLAADEAVKRCEAEVREAVLQLGQSVRDREIGAVYARGRVTWDGKGLSEYAQTHPEVEVYRRVGQPTVRLCYPREEETS